MDLIKAVARLETQDGTRTVGDNNLFNIKDVTGTGKRAKDIAEGSNDAYKGYATRQESIDDFVSLLQRLPRYKKAYEALLAGDAKGFATGLKEGGYATDPKYAEKLMGVINENK